MDPSFSKADFFAIRLQPGDDLKRSILSLSSAHDIHAGVIVSCVGSLRKINLRYADKKEGTSQQGKFEIISLVGTFGNGSGHFHISVADGNGEVKGGHLLEQNIIYTTAELVVAALKDLHFGRETDETYGYKELIIKNRD